MKSFLLIISAPVRVYVKIVRYEIGRAAKIFAHEVKDAYREFLDNVQRSRNSTRL